MTGAPDHVSDIQDQRHAAVAQDGRPRDTGDLSVIGLEVLDHHLVLAEQFVDNPAVSQALLISHAEHEGGPDGLVTGNVIGLRFTEGFGRLVSFDDPVPIGFDEVSLSDSYIVHVCDALLNDAERTTHPADTYESFIGRMVEGLEQRGWFVSNELTHP